VCYVYFSTVYGARLVPVYDVISSTLSHSVGRWTPVGEMA